jgi:Na+/proline symporter
MVRGVVAGVLLAAALAAAVHAMMLQLVTLATNDPHDYQPLLRSGLFWSTISVIGVVAFVFLVRGYWRLAGLAPLAICSVAWWGIARMWPYAFG